MRTSLSVLLGSILLCSGLVAAGQKQPAPRQPQKQSETMTPGMRAAIAFERAKDRADARQAAIEAKHPTVTYDHADRSAQDEPTTGRKVPDPGPRK
jgi:hypothetical protein